jgi:hydrogenase expression/formation protein HypC
MQLVEINGDRGRVSTWGVELEVALDLVDDVSVGDYVIVHAGFAIKKLDEASAMETIRLLKEAAAFVDDLESGKG